MSAHLQYRELVEICSIGKRDERPPAVYGIICSIGKRGERPCSIGKNLQNKEEG